jgi:uncharacterized protein YgbK (DUF1537 family)
MFSSERILVVADDLTGAAEIAGIVRRYGLGARIVRAVHGLRDVADEGATVIDTDSRALSANEAADRVRRVLEPLPASFFTLVYKKTDSALRGPVLAEVNAVMSWSGATRSALLAQNPSRGRTIQDGIYRVDGVPIDRTPFARDPQHPARSSRVLELLGEFSGLEVHSAVSHASDLKEGLSVCDARNEDDVLWRAALLPGDVLPAGGADFFGQLLEVRGLRRRKREPLPPFTGSALLVRGTTAPPTEEEEKWIDSRWFADCAAPVEMLYEPSQRERLHRFAAMVARSLELGGRVAVSLIGDVKPSASIEIERSLAEVVQVATGAFPVEHLLLTGGATAAAVCRRMGWNTLSVSRELSPGVVMCGVSEGSGPQLTLKPGSYPWPGAWI